MCRALCSLSLSPSLTYKHIEIENICVYIYIYDKALYNPLTPPLKSFQFKHNVVYVKIYISASENTTQKINIRKWNSFYIKQNITKYKNVRPAAMLVSKCDSCSYSSWPVVAAAAPSAAPCWQHSVLDNDHIFVIISGSFLGVFQPVTSSRTTFCKLTKLLFHHWGFS